MTEHNSGQKQSIIFLHIPKTAGTTLQRIIEKQYSPKGIHSFGPNSQESIKKFKQLPEAQRGEIQVLKGHMGFGLHQFLPRASTYITIVRDPVDRVVSYYYHILRDPNHYLHQQVVTNGTSLKEVICNGMTPNLDNAQARYLSGMWFTVPYGHCSADMLERAKKNLRDHFTVVGLAERFDETLLLLRRAFGWRMPLYVSANVTQNRPSKESFSQDTLRAIERYNELDFELYDYAEGLLENQISQYGFLFTLELVAF